MEGCGNTMEGLAKTKKTGSTGWYLGTWGGSAPGAAVWPAVEVAPMYSATHYGESTRLLQRELSRWLVSC